MILIDTERLELLAEREALKAKADPLLKRIAQIDDLLKNDSKINWNERAVQCLSQVKEPLTTDEILNYVFYRKEDEIRDSKKRRDYVLQLSLSLIRLCEKGHLFKEKVEGYRGNIYGLSDWKERPEYEYICNQKKRKLIDENRRFFSIQTL